RAWRGSPCVQAAYTVRTGGNRGVADAGRVSTTDGTDRRKDQQRDGFACLLAPRSPPSARPVLQTLLLTETKGADLPVIQMLCLILFILSHESRPGDGPMFRPLARLLRAALFAAVVTAAVFVTFAGVRLLVGGGKINWLAEA